MKSLILNFLLFATFTTFSQVIFVPKPKPKPLAHPLPKIHLGWSITDQIFNTLAFEGMYRFKRNGIILGYGNTFGDILVSSSDAEDRYELLRGHQVKLNHKVYITGEDDVFLSFVHGPILQSHTLPYYRKDWVPFMEDGLILYKLGDVEETFRADRLGYDARLNLEYVWYFFSLDIGIGFNYRHVVSDQEVPEGYDLNDWFTGITYQGFRPSMQIKVGFYLDAFAY